MLNFIEINSKNKPKSSVILLHGLGASGSDFVDIVPQFSLPNELGVRFIFPDAPIHKITWAGGEEMRAWFDFVSLDKGSPEDEVGIRESQALIEELIYNEISRGITAKNIVLMGFSQGGAMSLHTGLRFKQQLAGIVALSCWLPLANSLKCEKSTTNANTPILVQHGSKDPVIPLSWAEESVNNLIKQKFTVRFDSYPMKHEVCREEVHVIGRWLQELINF